MGHPTDGILLIDKDEGEFSYGVVKKVKSTFGTFKVRKVGHAGTLDPFASGLLIILLGQGTKLSHFLMSGEKAYLAVVKLGAETDTLDPTGRVVRSSSVPELTPEFILEKAQGFLGDIEQVPPDYSAVKYEGTRAYKLARRGLKVDFKKRTVTVYLLRILSIDLPDVTMEIRCSRGTYIRRLAADLGRELGTGGHLKSLRRLASGSFKVQDALSSKMISPKLGCSVLQDIVIPLRAALPGMCEMEVEDRLAEKVRRGYQPSWEELAKGTCSAGRRPGDADSLEGYEDGYVKLVGHGELVAIMKVKEEQIGRGKVKTARVFW